VIDVNRLLERVVGDCQLDAQNKQCRISYTSHSSPACPGNEELLHRAVENIARNAIRYAPSGTDVEIELCVSGREAAVKVRDFGPGVPEEKLARIFDPFFRVEASRDSTEGGIGLGLAIARRAVNVHGGTLTAENANPGLLVVMRIPFSPPNAGSELAKTEKEKSKI
jgi:signal transduction histidine kinase